MRRRISVFLLACSLGAAACPARAADSDNLLSGYELTSWIEGDGAPLGTVHSIVQDRDGYLWIGADAGLLRFDGSRFTPWDTVSDSPKSPVSALYLSGDGSLWVGFGDGTGVRRIRNGQMRPHEQPHELTGSVTDLVEDQRGTLWAISDTRLYRLDGDDWRQLPLPWNERESPALRLHRSANGDLWVGTTRGLFRRVKDTDRFQREAAGYVWDISEDAAGTTWITDIAAGFRRIGQLPPPSRTPEGGGYRLMHDRQGNLWVATLGDGLWLVRGGGQAPGLRIERTALRTGLSSNTVQSLMEDRDGNIWVGTTTGMHRLRQRALTPIEGIGFAISVGPADDGSVWVGTTNGLIRYSTALPSWTRAGSGVGLIVLALHRDRHGTLWVGTTKGLWRVTGGRLELIRLRANEALTSITLIESDARGLWLGNNDWLFHWDGANLVRLPRPPRLGSARITVAHADTSGRLWVAFDDGQLGVVEQQTFRMLGPGDGFAPDVHRAINSIVDDQDGSVWIGGSGLSRFVNGRVVTVNEKNGLPGNRVSSIIDGGDGDLWLSVDRGLVHLHRDEVKRATENAAHRLQYRLYGTSDGLAGSPIGSIRSTRGSDGRLWFVRGGGLTVVDPLATMNDHLAQAAPLRIQAAVANEQRVNATDGMSLPPGTKRLQISYTALALTTSSRIQFRYRLDGLDTDWVEAGTQRSAFYTNLSPGRYRFRVDANADDGMLNTSAATWDFIIRPTFYQTYWFYTLCAGTVVLIIWAAWRARLRLVRRQFSLVLAERARLSREIHDTLLQSLVGVALQCDVIANSVDLGAATTKSRLVKVGREVETYIREARQSIWDLRSPMLETHDLPTALREFGKRSAAGKGVRFVTTVTGMPRQWPAKVQNQLLRIGQEAITNAIRHSQAKRIDLELRFDRGSVILRVADDGCGFDGECPAPSTNAHYGLTTMRERAEELGGHFRIATFVGRGTEVEAVVPLASKA